MKTAPINKILIFLSLLFFTLLQISCAKNKDEFIEFTYGLNMDPEFPRAGIKLKSDNYVYYCEEIMNIGDKYYLNNQTGKYKFYKSEDKIDFSKYKKLVIENFAEKIHKNYISIADATYEQIDFKLDSQKVKQGFLVFN